MTDAGLVELATFSNLKELGLNQTRVTDNGVLRLTGLANLTFLDLFETEVSDAGVATLRSALPGLRIEQ